MSHILNYLSIAAGVVFLFGAAIFVHEFGHFWVALKRGLKVDEFSIGFGPKIFSRVRNGIEYSVRWIPAGGFVKLPQMVSSPIEGDAKHESAPPAPPLSKILVSVAGPAMNVVFAFALATVIYFVGVPVSIIPSVIGYVDPKSPEGKMGIREGDRIVELDHKPVKTWEEVNQMTILALTNVLPVTIVHTNGESNTYFLKAEVNNLVHLKTLNLDPRDHLIVNQVRGKPAALAGIKVDDEVVGFAGVPVSSHPQLTSLIQLRGDQETPIVVKREGRRLTLLVTPTKDAGSTNYIVGVVFGLGKDVYNSISHPTPWANVSGVCANLYGTVRALLHPRASGVGPSELSGPVGIISVLGLELHTDYRLALNFLVMLNINLAILNLLPIPVLDGGHIVMTLIERIARRPLEVRFVESLTTVFAIVLICFMLYVTYFDIGRFKIFRMMFNRDVQIEQSAKPAAPAPAPQPAP